MIKWIALYLIILIVIYILISLLQGTAYAYKLDEVERVVFSGAISCLITVLIKLYHEKYIK